MEDGVEDASKRAAARDFMNWFKDASKRADENVKAKSIPVDQIEKGLGQLEVDRRQFLQGSALVAAEAAGVPVISKAAEMAKNYQTEREASTQEIIAGIESMSEEELRRELYENQPVVPDIEKIAENIKNITDIPPNSYIMKVGTSVAHGMLESVYSENVDQSQINFGSEQDQLENVLEHTRFPQGALDANSVSGMDIGSIMYDSMLCRDAGEFKCSPGKSATDSYIDQFDPKVAITMIGTNMIRNKASLEEFAQSAEAMIDYFVSQDVIPVLTTLPQPFDDEGEFADWFDNPYTIVHSGQDEQAVLQDEIDYRSVWRPENAMKYNVLLIKLAEKHQIPIINLQRGVVESAENNGKVQKGGNVPENDPVHFSIRAGEQPLSVLQNGEKFSTGEEAVSYYTVKTLDKIIKAANA